MPLDETVDILASYRKNCAIGTPEGQLVLPDCLKTLPLYSMCIMKTPLMRMNSTGQISYNDIDVRADVRAFEANVFLLLLYREYYHLMFTHQYYIYIHIYLIYQVQIIGVNMKMI